MVLKWPPPVLVGSQWLVASFLMRAGQGVLKSRVRGERLVGEGETMELAGAMEGEKSQQLGQTRGGGSWEERRRLAESLV